MYHLIPSLPNTFFLFSIFTGHDSTDLAKKTWIICNFASNPSRYNRNTTAQNIFFLRERRYRMPEHFVIKSMHASHTRLPWEMVGTCRGFINNSVYRSHSYIQSVDKRLSVYFRNIAGLTYWMQRKFTLYMFEGVLETTVIKNILRVTLIIANTHGL